MYLIFVNVTAQNMFYKALHWNVPLSQLSSAGLVNELKGLVLQGHSRVILDELRVTPMLDVEHALAPHYDVRFQQGAYEYERRQTFAQQPCQYELEL